MKKVRVRFAPSPTGPLHLGGVRTALYNYLFAKKHGGDFILRIEDTDATRFVPGAEAYIIEALKWCGITPNEGVGFGDGPHGPYRQSERKPIYREYVDKLIATGHAYYAFDTSAELDARRASNKLFMYNGTTRDTLRNSLTLSADETESIIDGGAPYVVRFKMPRNTEVVVKDISRGLVKVNTNTLDDKVLFKSDGMPTYHLANIVDDHLMEITHVIRGEEWLPSAPLHVLLYDAFGWNPPEFCHLALILGPNGKLSKRDMDTLGFPVYPLDWTDPATGDTATGYREMGYLPEAFINMLGFIGWNPGNGIEIMNTTDMALTFSLEKVQKAGAKFDPKKAEWFSKEYMKIADDSRLAEMWIPYLLDKVVNDDHKIPAELMSLDYRKKVVHLLKEKVAYLGKFWESGDYFFASPSDHSLLNSMTSDDEGVDSVKLTFIRTVLDRFEKLDSDGFDADATKLCFDASIADSGIEPRDAGKILRAAVCGNKVGPPMFDILALLGKHRTVSRMRTALTKSSNMVN